MKLKWYGTAALLIYDGESVIAFDPFLGIRHGSRRPEDVSDESAWELAQASDVFVTHGHFDHIIQIPAVYAGGSAAIHATATPCRTMKERGMSEKQLDGISPGWRYNAGSISVRAYHGQHCRFDALLVIKTAFRYLRPGNLRHGLRLLQCNMDYPENGEILFYELECGGKRLQIMGSMGLDPDEEYPTGADLLVLPYQGKSGPAEYAASLVGRLKPKAVLLDHYDDSFPPMTALVDTSEFEKLMREKYNIPCRAMKREITYDTEELPL